MFLFALSEKLKTADVGRVEKSTHHASIEEQDQAVLVWKLGSIIIVQDVRKPVTIHH